MTTPFAIAEIDAGKSRLWHRRLYRRVLLGLLLTSIVIGAGATWLLYDSWLEQSRQSVLRDVDLAVMTLETEISAYKNLAAQITSRSRIRQELESYLAGEVDLEQLVRFSETKLLDAMRLSPVMVGIQRLDPQGNPLISVGQSLPLQFWPEDYRSDEIRVGFPARVADRRLLAVSAPIVNRDNRRVGFDVIIFDTANLSSIVEGFARRESRSGVAQIASVDNGRILLYYDLHALALKLDRQILLAESLESLQGLEEGFHVSFMHGRQVSLVHRRVKGSDWVFFYIQDARDFFAPARSAALVVGLAVALLALAGAVLTQRLIRPLAGRISVETSLMRDLLETNQELLEEVQVSERRLQSILDNASSLIYLKDLQGRYLLVNKAFLELLGVLETDVIGKIDSDLFARESANLMALNDHFVVEHGIAQEFDESIVVAQQQRDYHSIKFPVADPGGNVYAIGGISSDISERKEARRKLESSRALYRDLVEKTHDWIWEVDDKGFYTYASPRSETLLGYRPDEIIGKTPFDLMPPEEATRVAAKFARIVEQRLPFTGLENINRHRNGHTVILETSGSPIFDELGHFAGYRGTDRDISDRKRNEQALRRSEQRFDLAMRASNDGLWDWDMVSNEVYLSPRWKNMLGYEDDELENSFSTWRELIDEEQRDNAINKIEQCVNGECDEFETEFRIRHKQGHWVDILSRAITIRDHSGKALRMVGTHVDISARKATERRLAEYHDRPVDAGASPDG